MSIDPPITYSKDISPVCLPPANHDADQFVGKDAAIMGWGTLKFGKNKVSNFSSRIVRRQCTKSSLAANCGSKSLHQIPRKFDVTIIIDSHFCFFFKNSIEGEQPNELQQATVTVISNARCERERMILTYYNVMWRMKVSSASHDSNSVPKPME